MNGLPRGPLPRVVAAGSIVMLAVSAATASAERLSAVVGEPLVSTEGVEVPVYGRVVVRQVEQDAELAPVVMSVHGVRRVPGGTVVYYSAGSQDEQVRLSLSDATGAMMHLSPGSRLGTVRVVDQVGDAVYSVVADPAEERAVPFASAMASLPTEAGAVGVAYSVLPELPASVDRVDVELVYGVTVPDVPVEEGFMEPGLDPEQVIPVGTGWPRVDPSVIARVEDPQKFVYSLRELTESLDGSSRRSEAADQVTVDLAADVLFAVDKADVTDGAAETIDRVAGAIKEDAAAGSLRIVGHTDDQGSDSYNLDLSKRRAQAVAAVVTPLLDGVDLDVVVEGRGEAEPVSDNATEQGRAENRRVSLSYVSKGD